MQMTKKGISTISQHPFLGRWSFNNNELGRDLLGKFIYTGMLIME